MSASETKVKKPDDGGADDRRGTLAERATFREGASGSHGSPSQAQTVPAGIPAAAAGNLRDGSGAPGPVVDGPGPKAAGDARDRPEAKDLQEGKVNADAWENPGRFAVETDNQGRTTKIEGWLALRDTARSAALQKESTAGHERADRLDGGHLIAHSLGGPSVESHGKDEARRNLVACSSRPSISSPVRTRSE
jgi:hypothetical protein